MGDDFAIENPADLIYTPPTQTSMIYLRCTLCFLEPRSKFLKRNNRYRNERAGELWCFLEFLNAKILFVTFGKYLLYRA